MVFYYRNYLPAGFLAEKKLINKLQIVREYYKMEIPKLIAVSYVSPAYG